MDILFRVISNDMLTKTYIFLLILYMLPPLIDLLKTLYKLFLVYIQYIFNKGNIRILINKNKEENNKQLKVVNNIIRCIQMCLLFLIVILTLFFTARFVFNILHIAIANIYEANSLGHELSIYISLSIVLTAISYIPDKFCLWQMYILGWFIRNKPLNLNDTIPLYKKTIILLRPKLWLYLFSVFVTIISVLEDIGSTILISSKSWREIQPFIFESIITVIVIDRFVKQFQTERKSIKDEIQELVQINNKTFSL